jgi:hypothetical protein
VTNMVPQIRSDGSLAKNENRDESGPRQCGECAGNPWTICGVCGRRMSEQEPEFDTWGLMNWDDDNGFEAW